MLLGSIKDISTECLFCTKAATNFLLFMFSLIQLHVTPNSSKPNFDYSTVCMLYIFMFEKWNYNSQYTKLYL